MKTAATILSVLVAVSCVCLSTSSTIAQTAGSSSYRNLNRYEAPAVKTNNPFSKLMDFSFKKPSSNASPPSLMERLDKLSLFKREPEQRQVMNSIEDFAKMKVPQQTQPRFSLSKLFPPKDPTAPGFLSKLGAKTSGLFSKKPEWALPKPGMGETNWEQASREIKASAQNLLRDSRSMVTPNQSGANVPSPQPPLRSANREPNIRY